MQFLSRYNVGNERIDGSPAGGVSSGRRTICIFVLGPGAPSSSYLNIMALRGAFSMQFAQKNTDTAEDTARKIGKRWGSYRSSSSDIIPLRVSSKYYFSFFLLDVDIKVVAKPTALSFRNGFCHFLVAGVIFSAMGYRRCSS